MKTIIFVISILLNTINAQAQLFRLNAKASTIEWTGYGEVGNFSQSGSLECKDGEFEYQDGRFISGNLVLDMKTISHNDRKLEKHLKAEDFFNVNKYPIATVKIISGNDHRIVGLLTLHDMSNQLSMDIEIDEVGRTMVLKGEISIDRTKYDIKYNSSSYFQDLGSYAIKNEFDLKVYLSFVSKGKNEPE